MKLEHLGVEPITSRSQV